MDFKIRFMWTALYQVPMDALIFHYLGTYHNIMPNHVQNWWVELMYNCDQDKYSISIATS